MLDVTVTYDPLSALPQSWNLEGEPSLVSRLREIANPYWDAVLKFPWEHLGFSFGPEWYSCGWQGMAQGKPCIHRRDLCLQYAWAIPDPASLAFAAHFLAPRAIEIGAGTGYWAWLLSHLGVEMTCFDIAPPDLLGTNDYHSPRDPDGNLLGGYPRGLFPCAQGR